MSDTLPSSLEKFAAPSSAAFWKADREGRLVHTSEGVDRRIADPVPVARPTQTGLMQVLDEIEDGTLLFDAEGFCTFANRAALQITGLRLDALIGGNVEDLLGHRQAVTGGAVPDTCLARLAKGVFPGDEALFLRGVGGTVVDASVTGRPLGLENAATPTGYIVRLSTKGVSDRNQALQKLELDIMKMTSAGEALEDICHFITAGVDALIPGVKSSVVLIDDRGVMRHCIAAHLPPSWTDSFRGKPIGEGKGLSGTAAFRKELVIVRDTSTDPLWKDCASHAREYGVRSCWSFPILDANGRVIATLSTYCDRPHFPSDEEIALIERIAQYVRLAIERTHDRDRIRAEAARYRTIFDLVPVGIWQNDTSDVAAMIQSVRAQGVVDFGAYLDAHPDFVTEAIKATRVIDANPAALSQYGITSATDISAAFRAVSLTPQSLRTTRDILVAMFEGRTRVELIDHVKNAAGRNITLLSRVHIPQDHLDRFLLCETDVTEHYRAVELFETVARISSDVIWQRDVETDETWNSDIHGRLNHGETGALHKRGFWIEHLHPDDRQATVALADDAINGDITERAYEYRYRRGDGTYAHIREKAAYIRDDQGKTVRVIGNMVDMSERKLLEEKLCQSQRLEAVGQLTGGMAHDFNNLLTIIIGNIERMTALLNPEDEASQLASSALGASERAAELITRLLAFARKQPLSPRAMDANAVIQGMCDLLTRTLTPEVELQHCPGQDLWSAHVDVVQFESALLNLCVNARHAMPGGGRLTIRTENVTLGNGVICQGEPVEPGDYVLVSVADTGHGMSEEVLARAFEPFFSTKPAGQGSGLGLSMVFGFLRQSRGYILVESKPSHGTEMRLYLPRAFGNVLQERSAEQLPDPVELSLRVLLVEDDEMVRDYLTAQVASTGCEVVAVADAHTALKVLSTDSRFDIVLSDVVMPGGMSGLQLAEVVARDHPHIRLVLSSGYAFEQVVVGNNKDLRAIFLKKPYRRAKLVAALRDAMADFT